jgi:hypothetical protein
MTKVDILIDNEIPELSLDESTIFLYGTPLLVLYYSGFQLNLTKSAIFQLKQALKNGEGRLDNYRRIMESANNLKLPFVELN